MDAAWWKKYFNQYKKTFKGECLSVSRHVAGVTAFRIRHPKNSGAGAMVLANHRGAERIILLGYDCQYTNGKKHWHGDHPKSLGNAKSLPKWFEQFTAVAKTLGHCEIINASRSTALKIWPRQSLEQALNS